MGGELHLPTESGFSKHSVSAGVRNGYVLCRSETCFDWSTFSIRHCRWEEKGRGMCGSSSHQSAFNGTSYMFP